MMAGVYAANCFFVINNRREAIIIDPGGDFKDIVKNIDEKEIIPKYILLTHGHGDHIAAVNELKEKYEIPVLVHEDEVELLSDPEMNMSARMPINPVSVNADITFLDGESICDEFNIKVIHTPGHTAGSCCFLIGDKLITGDTVFRGSIGRSDLPTGNYDDIMQSIKNKILLMDDSIEIFPGHGTASTIETEKQINPYFAELMV